MILMMMMPEARRQVGVVWLPWHHDRLGVFGLGGWVGCLVVGLCVVWFGGSSTQKQKHENKHKTKQHKNMKK